MFKKSFIPLVFLTSSAWALTSLFVLSAKAQTPQTIKIEQPHTLTILKQQDFSTTLNALEALTHRATPVENTVPNENTANTTGENVEKPIKSDDLKQDNQGENATAKEQETKNEPQEPKNIQESIKEKIDDIVKTTKDKTANTEKENIAETKEQTEPQRVVLPRQHIELHFANYQDTRLFLKELTQKFGAPIEGCSRSSINFYRLPDDFTLRVHLTNLNPDEVSQGSSVDGINGIRMMLIDGKLSNECDIDTLKDEERVSFDVLKQLVQNIINAGNNLDEEKAEALISQFGTPERSEKDCFITYSIKPEKDLPQLNVSITALKPDCKPKAGFKGLLVNYEPQEKNGVILASDPAMPIKMARALEETFNMDGLHNIAYLWKNGDIFGVIRTPVFPTMPMAFQIEEAKGKLSLEVGKWYGDEQTHYQTLWNAGEQPYGGLTTSEEFIP